MKRLIEITDAYGRKTKIYVIGRKPDPVLETALIDAGAKWDLIRDGEEHVPSIIEQAARDFLKSLEGNRPFAILNGLVNKPGNEERIQARNSATCVLQGINALQRAVLNQDGIDIRAAVPPEDSTSGIPSED